jgi:hypothetical protein
VLGLSIHSCLLHKVLNVCTRFSFSFGAILSTLGRKVGVWFGQSTEAVLRQFLFLVLYGQYQLWGGETSFISGIAHRGCYRYLVFFRYNCVSYSLFCYNILHIS